MPSAFLLSGVGKPRAPHRGRHLDGSSTWLLPDAQSLSLPASGTRVNDVPQVRAFASAVPSAQTLFPQISARLAPTYCSHLCPPPNHGSPPFPLTLFSLWLCSLTKQLPLSLLCSSLELRCLEQDLLNSRYSENICWRNTSSSSTLNTKWMLVGHCIFSTTLSLSPRSLH